MNLKRAFTLIELLIVISIISMLSSIVLATTTTVRAKARDGQRIQQVRQIDLALRLYIETNGHAPYLGSCETQSSTPTGSAISGCIAVSTPGVAGSSNWQAFINEISPFMPNVPGDPCGATCSSGSGFSIGYTYVAPLAVQFYCNNLPNCTANNSSYQMYAPLELQLVSFGSNGLSSNYFSATGINDTIPPSIPQITQFIYTDGGLRPQATISWNASSDTGGSGLAGYKVSIGVNGGALTDINFTSQLIYYKVFLDTTPTSVCIEVSAYDNIGNESVHSPVSCKNLNS